MIQHHGKLSSFADPADIKAFDKWFKIYRDEGMSVDDATKKAFKRGDNGIGKWGDDTKEGSGPSCAVTPDDMIERWGSMDAARGKDIRVIIGNEDVVCKVKDRLPWKKYITNGVILDLNPDAVRALKQTPPMLKQGIWYWLD